MDTLISCLWIALGIAMMVYLFFRNRKYTRVLTQALNLTEVSAQHCEDILSNLRNEGNRAECNKLLRELEEERTHIQGIFSHEKDWPGQAKRIKTHLSRVNSYIEAGHALLLVRGSTP